MPAGSAAPFWLRFKKQSFGSSRRGGARRAMRDRTVAGIGVGMSEDLLSLRAMVMSQDQELCDLFRRAASFATIPTEIVDGAALARGNADLAYVDGALPPERAAHLVATLRTAANPPFIALLATSGGKSALEADALAGKPSRLEEAKWLLDRSLRVRLTTRVLIVDDSATIRAIVRKALMATRFPFEVSEAADGAETLKLLRDEEFDVIFIDQNMPDVSGLETLAKIKEIRPDITTVMMSSAQNKDLAAGARALGAAFLKKPFFPPDIENVLCGFYGLRALNPKRA